jgi:hypothetical protein
MDADAVRARATEFCDAIVAGDVDKAAESMSNELRQRLGEVVSLLPLPSNEATVESVEHSGAGYNVVLRLVGETDEVEIQTRWKDRDGAPKMVETSNLSRVARAAEEPAAEAEGDGGATVSSQ